MYNVSNFSSTLTHKIVSLAKIFAYMYYTHTCTHVCTHYTHAHMHIHTRTHDTHTPHTHKSASRHFMETHRNKFWPMKNHIRTYITANSNLKQFTDFTELSLTKQLSITIMCTSYSFCSFAVSMLKTTTGHHDNQPQRS